jgi:D-tyrosyl-tRNA(Tyr) deacylase
MRGVVQKVAKAKVSVAGEITGEISQGILLLLSVGTDDTETDADYLLSKVLKLRIFEDKDGRMNLCLGDIKGELLVVSQFTLHGDVRKGLRPSFIRAAEPALAEKLYDYFVTCARKQQQIVETGRFRAMMEVELINDGPVTILLDSKKEF